LNSDIAQTGPVCVAVCPTNAFRDGKSRLELLDEVPFAG
jgi:hypothetical protein